MQHLMHPTTTQASLLNYFNQRQNCKIFYHNIMILSYAMGAC